MRGIAPIGFASDAVFGKAITYIDKEIPARYHFTNVIVRLKHSSADKASGARLEKSYIGRMRETREFSIVVK